MGGGQGRHHLSVLRIVKAPCQAGSQMRFQLPQPVGGDLVRPHTGRSLSGREVAQGPHPGLVGGDHEAALGLVLDLRREQFGKLLPQPGGQQREIEFGAGFLVGDQEIALTGTRGAARDGAAVEHGDGEAGAGGVVGTGRADHARSDDDDIRASSQGHVSNISHCTGAAKGAA